MAIHWEHIKGVNQEQNSDPVYSFIEFSKISANTVSSLPHLYINTKNDKATATDLGYFITSKATGQQIESAFEFSSDLNVQANLTIGTDFTIVPSRFNSDGYNRINGNNIINGNITFSKNYKVRIENNTTSINPTDSPLYVAGSGYIGGAMYVDDYCEAQYFNARSDKRAKENIKPFSGNALDIVNKINTYTFNYKNNPNQVSYGILAQDLLDVNINNFNFINNKEATGINDDYMSIKESKLVYLLIEAVKEQQKEIEDLKTELKALKK